MTKYYSFIFVSIQEGLLQSHLFEL